MQVLHIECIKIVVKEYLINTVIESIDNVLAQSSCDQISRVV